MSMFINRKPDPQEGPNDRPAQRVDTDIIFAIKKQAERNVARKHGLYPHIKVNPHATFLRWECKATSGVTGYGINASDAWLDWSNKRNAAIRKAGH